MTPNGGIPPSASNVEHDRIMEPIAVISMAARLPEDEESGVDFWEMIKRGHTAASKIPKDRINMDAFYHPNADRSDTTNVRSRHFLKGNIAAFDAPFFTIKPTEAESMDPQQRMLLETSFHALENGTHLVLIQRRCNVEFMLHSWYLHGIISGLSDWSLLCRINPGLRGLDVSRPRAYT
ncbi:MAG: hypothetical protein Q9198_001723 [Flavoplaca austrocitrina]